MFIVVRPLLFVVLFIAALAAGGSIGDALWGPIQCPPGMYFRENLPAPMIPHYRSVQQP